MARPEPEFCYVPMQREAHKLGSRGDWQKTSTFVPATRPGVSEMLGFISFSPTYRADMRPVKHKMAWVCTRSLRQ